ncbi:MAG TPA: ABC transporter substrate-binding protein [Anaerolineaceae bacterium]|nr:ABC transporter substrate-binding protein [Anaerolineaceae bacterium]
MLKKRFFSLVLASILILSFVFSSVVVSADGGGTTIFLPVILKSSTLAVATQLNQIQNLNPFFRNTTSEEDIVNLTQLNLVTMDRQGMVVENAITGETRSFNGTPYTYTGPADVDIEINTTTGNTLYTFTLRTDLKFGDGMPVSVDDLIFTLYTFLDPSYDGSNGITTLPILGLQNYQTQTTPEIFEKYADFYASIYESGKDHVWDPSDPWTQDQQTDVWNRLEEALAIEVEKIVNFIVTNYTDAFAEEMIGFSPEEVYANEGLQVAFAMRYWGFAQVNTTTKLMTANFSGKTWDLNYEYPTQPDIAEEILLCYNDDYRAAFPNESPDGNDLYEQVKVDFIGYWGPLDPDMIGGIPNISGIQRVSDTTVTVEIDGFETNWIYSLAIPITPLHYYGSTDKYNYALNMFGFDIGNLSLQRSKDNAPMGAGPYQFAYKLDGVNYLGANSYYYKGEPKITRIRFVEDASHSLPGAINAGSFDLASTPYDANNLAEIYALNSNGELTGDIITTSKFDNLGYGYIGINARLVKVGDDPASTASRDLRKAFSTILAVHRRPANKAYYGVDGASTLEYPIILSSWASPQPEDPGYHEAFSVDVNGAPLYTPGMTQSQRVAAAQQAALGFFEAAGFTISGGMVVDPPAGAKLTYEVIVPGGGMGNHPAYSLLIEAQETLSEIGITLTIIDPPDVNVMWDALRNGTQELWTAAWGLGIDVNLFDAYHSSNTFDQPDGTRSNHYYIQDQALDMLIMQARSSDDQALRKQLYQQAFDIIMDWAAEIPNYARKSLTLFSTQRINAATITPDITPFWSWQNDIEDMSMK